MNDYKLFSKKLNKEIMVSVHIKDGKITLSQNNQPYSKEFCGWDNNNDTGWSQWSRTEWFHTK